MKKIYAKFDCDAPEYAGNNNLKIYFYKCYFPEIRGFFYQTGDECENWESINIIEYKYNVHSLE